MISRSTVQPIYVVIHRTRVSFFSQKFISGSSGGTRTNVNADSKPATLACINVRLFIILHSTILVSSSLKFWMQFFYLKKSHWPFNKFVFFLSFSRTRNIFAESPRPYHPHVIPILFRSVCDAILRSKWIRRTAILFSTFSNTWNKKKKNVYYYNH